MTEKQAKRLAKALALLFLDAGYNYRAEPISSLNHDGLWGVNIWVWGAHEEKSVEFLDSHHDAKRFCQFGPTFRETDRPRSWI